MLTEAVFGPIWAWLFINEIPPTSVIIGGGIIISAILFEFFLVKKKNSFIHLTFNSYLARESN